MHLHQELEGFYLGNAPRHSPERPGTFAPIPPSHGLRLSTAHKHGKESRHPTPAVPKEILLIVEDFDEIRSELSRHFADRGCDVFSAATLRDALAIAWEQKPNVIFIDFDLSGHNIFHVVEQLRETLPNSSIVLIGGPSAQQDHARAIAAGASKILSESYPFYEVDRILKAAANSSWLP